MEYSIVTLPRVGSHYIQDRILQHTGLLVKRHLSLQDNKMITIVRDPVEVLTSDLTRKCFYDTSNSTLSMITNDILRTESLNCYAKYFTGIDDMDVIDRFYTIIDYRNLTEFPFETTKALAKKMNVEVINEKYENGHIKDNPNDRHIVSSKNVKEYDMIKKYVESTDLSKVYDVYNAMLDRCLKI
jgi:hypothetical protein